MIVLLDLCLRQSPLMEIEDLDGLHISTKTRSRQQHVVEGRRVVRMNSKYRNDPNYRFFINEVVTGLLRESGNKSIFETIRMLQKMIKPTKHAPHKGM